MEVQRQPTSFLKKNPSQKKLGTAQP